MLDRLIEIEKNYEDLTAQISSPEIMSDMSTYAKTMKQHRVLEEIVVKYRDVKRMNEELAGAKELLDAAGDDAEMREMAQMEITELDANLAKADAELKFLLIPQDPNDEKNVILEIRAGSVADVCALRRTTGLENGDYGRGGHRSRRVERSVCDDRRRQGLLENAV